MLTLKKTALPLMSAFFLSTAVAGGAFAQSETTHDPSLPCGSDASGDVKTVPCPEADAEAAAEAPAEGAPMVGDADGDEPLSAEQQVQGTTDGSGETVADGDQPTNQPVIDTTEGNDS